MSAHKAAADHAGEGTDDDVQPARHRRQIERGQRGEERAEIDLALGPDVEQAGAQRQHDGEAGEQQRRHLHQRGGDAVIFEEGAVKERGIGGDRVGAAGHDDDGADQQRAQNGPHALGRIEQADGRGHINAPPRCRP